MKQHHIRRAVALLLATLLTAISLSSCGASMLSQTTVEEMTFILYGKDRVNRIEVKRGQERIGTYAQKGLPRDMLDAAGDDSYGFLVTDLNFDHKPDMQLAVARNKNGTRHAVYLWDENEGEYVYHEFLSTLQDVGMIASLEVITAREYAYHVDPATTDTPEFYSECNRFILYRWIDGQLTEVHRKEKTYYQESDIYCYMVYERTENGEMELIRESWITAERIDHDKYPLDASGFEGYVAP